VRGLFARLINAEPDEVAYTKNVSDGINLVAASIDWRAGDNAVLCSALEHPANLYPWLNLQRRRGVEIRDIPSRDGTMPVEAMVNAMDAHTRVVTTSLVTFAPGFRTDIGALGQACRERGALFLVDGAQGIGILHLDMSREPIDVLSVSTQKGLCAEYGMGFLYVRREWAERLSPVFLSRFSVDLGDAHEASAGKEYRLLPGARRFDVGNYNYLGVIAVEPPLELIGRIGTAAIEPYVCALAQSMARQLIACGVPVIGGGPNAHIVPIGVEIGTRHDATDDPQMRALYEALTAAGIRLTIRRGMIRASLHLYNNQEDVACLVATAQQWKKSR
jgi:selenocysteine lyase/cysteine desulfurase